MGCLDAKTGGFFPTLIGGWHEISSFGSPMYFNTWIDPVTTTNNSVIGTRMPDLGYANRASLTLDAPPGTGESVTITLVFDGVDSPIVLKISGATDFHAEDIVTKAQFNWKALVSWRLDASAGCASSWFSVGCLLNFPAN